MNTRARTHLHLALAGLLLMCTFAIRAAANDNLLFSFTGTSTGAHPYGALVTDGTNLFGTTFDGGMFGAGTIFELSPSVTGGYTETVLYNFMGAGDGGFPIAGLLRNNSGVLYGTTSCGGGSMCTAGVGGFGVVFEFSPAAGYVPLYAFTGDADGGNPVASLTFDSAMNLYGTTLRGGTGSCMGGTGCGVVFQLSAVSGYHSETPLYTFTGGTDGAAPRAPVIFNTAGTMLYGTTYQGGTGTCPGPATGCGVVFQLSLSGIEKVLHRFTGKSDGSLPVAPLTFNQTGTLLYGAASAGGKTICSGGCGTVFRLSGTALTTFHVMHSFAETDGADPTGGLALDLSDNSLYGTTFIGGADNLGVTYNLTQAGVYSLMHSFTGAPSDGANPYAGLLIGVGGGGEDAVAPPTKKDCTSGCSGTSVSGGSANSGSAYSN
jgi:uncharacterized repeat protein (TIGR03803 family)